MISADRQIQTSTLLRFCRKNLRFSGVLIARRFQVFEDEPRFSRRNRAGDRFRTGIVSGGLNHALQDQELDPRRVLAKVAQRDVRMRGRGSQRNIGAGRRSNGRH
jgi:hypothetical protein